MIPFADRRAYCSISKLSELCVDCLCDFSYGAISKCGLPLRLATQTVLKHAFNNFQIFTRKAHESAGQTFTNLTIANIYLNNQRKISTYAVVADGVRSFKKKQEKSKYEKQSITNNH